MLVFQELVKHYNAVAQDLAAAEEEWLASEQQTAGAGGARAGDETAQPGGSPAVAGGSNGAGGGDKKEGLGTSGARASDQPPNSEAASGMPATLSTDGTPLPATAPTVTPATDTPALDTESQAPSLSTSLSSWSSASSVAFDHAQRARQCLAEFDLVGWAVEASRDAATSSRLTRGGASKPPSRGDPHPSLAFVSAPLATAAAKWAQVAAAEGLRASPRPEASAVGTGGGRHPSEGTQGSGTAASQAPASRSEPQPRNAHQGVECESLEAMQSKGKDAPNRGGPAVAMESGKGASPLPVEPQKLRAVDIAHALVKPQHDMHQAARAETLGLHELRPDSAVDGVESSTHAASAARPGLPADAPPSMLPAAALLHPLVHDEELPLPVYQDADARDGNTEPTQWELANYRQWLDLELPLPEGQSWQQ